MTTLITQARLKQLECIEVHYTDIIAQGIAHALSLTHTRPHRRRRRKITIVRRLMTPRPITPVPITACPSPTAQILAPVQPQRLEQMAKLTQGLAAIQLTKPTQGPPDEMKIPIATKPTRKHTDSLLENPSMHKKTPDYNHQVQSETSDPPANIYNSIEHLRNSLLNMSFQ